MRIFRHLTLAALAIVCVDSRGADGAGMQFFETKVRPLLVEKCYECHSAEKTKGGLALDTKAGWEKGGDSGPAILPGKPDESLLIKAVRYHDKDHAMPPQKKGGKLVDGAIAALTEWVKMGAPDPREAIAKIGGMTPEDAKAWWAWQPLKASGQIATLLNSKQPRRTNTPVDKRTLIRRATFDLIGLPPTSEEVATFIADTSAEAFSKVVDRLLASPHYGEQWGRHWLDVVRYADSLDSRSYDKDGDILDAWRYRDWVVNAFNGDLPYDQFITHQLAGDILAAREWDERKVIATGMYAIGEWGNGDADKEKIHTDIVDDQIDVTCRAFLGITMACARCHDHKFDPFTTRDYYGLAGFFYSSHILAKFTPKGAGEKLMRIPLVSPQALAQTRTAQQRIGELDAQLAMQMHPLTEMTRDISGIAGLHSWKGKAVANPSAVVNTTDKSVAFSTIKLPAKAMCMHPGPKVPVTAAWRSPVNGLVQVSAKLRDADPNCGDGIEWEIRAAGQSLDKGVMDNAGSAEIATKAVNVKQGDLVQLIVRPRGEYTCDSTQTEFSVVAANGKDWNLVEAMISGVTPATDAVWMICSGEGIAIGQDNVALQALNSERKKLQTRLDMQLYAQGLQEGGIPATGYEGYHDARIHLRGRYDMLGDVAPRSTPGILTLEQPAVSEGSGRLELAHWIANAKNPLTARVMVNRLWQHHFGDGIVSTSNNFGKLGSPPTEPDLLDALAAQFIASGWSIKAMHRLIMNSEVYQEQSARRRLSAEELRDAMLVATGTLDPAIGGKSVRDLNTPRRTLYITTIRSDRSTYQALMDGANPAAIVEKRTDSVVAPQALWIMNHEFPLAQAKKLAVMVQAQPGDIASKARWLYQRLLQRDPTPREITLATRANGDWEAFAQVLLCSNEYSYVD
ncbi:MAG: hypothetical protein RL693_512 [Verrucomicrobiota bacterium]